MWLKFIKFKNFNFWIGRLGKKDANTLNLSTHPTAELRIRRGVILTLSNPVSIICGGTRYNLGRTCASERYMFFLVGICASERDIFFLVGHVRRGATCFLCVEPVFRFKL